MLLLNPCKSKVVPTFTTNAELELNAELDPACKVPPFRVVLPEYVLVAVKIAVPPSWVTLPPPLMALATVWLPLKSKTRAPLSVIVPLPAVPLRIPLPSCRVAPTPMVTLPKSVVPFRSTLPWVEKVTV